ncbi:flagellar radial spoke protein, putative [Leishmania tarentolae]|uniref:Flagellar radial spoke protein, putative n=1 Tax=Leishmania tarentolae TaxID=5689 RepID=A0A640KKS4_LEITA|nr:flagellar radial spoke protein, putative [Leishmania tarentolae]
MSGIDEHQIRQSALWGHMTQVLAQVIRERPANAMDALAAASNQLISGSAVPPMKGNIYADPRPTARAAAPVDSFTNTRWAANTNIALVPARDPHVAHAMRTKTSKKRRTHLPTPGRMASRKSTSRITLAPLAML